MARALLQRISSTKRANAAKSLLDPRKLTPHSCSGTQHRMKRSPLFLISFLVVLFVGTFAFYAMHGILAYVLVSLTGWGGWFAQGLRYWPVFLFWLIMFYIYWSKLR